LRVRLGPLQGGYHGQETLLRGADHQHLRQAEIPISQGKSVGEVSRQPGITEQTYYRWRKEYGGMDVSQARRLKNLEKENQQLKKLVADLSLYVQILKEVNRGHL
jgi:putative transposase